MQEAPQVLLPLCITQQHWYVTSSSAPTSVPAGGWQANTRYQMTLAVMNPAPPADSQSMTAAELPDVWLAPLTYSPLDDSIEQSARRMLVRGDKEGQACRLRYEIMGIRCRQLWEC